MCFITDGNILAQKNINLYVIFVKHAILEESEIAQT